MYCITEDLKEQRNSSLVFLVLSRLNLTDRNMYFGWQHIKVIKMELGNGVYRLYLSLQFARRNIM